MTPSVAIIIPTRDTLDYLPEAVDSVIQQLTPADQLIIVDDGSLDGTTEWLRQFRDDPRVEVVTTPPRGPGPARNIGVRRASTDYIAFLDADDIWIDGALARMCRQVRAYDWPDLVLFSGQCFGVGSEPYEQRGEMRQRLYGYFQASEEPLVRIAATGPLQVSAGLTLSRRMLWLAYPLEYPPGLHEDDALAPVLVAAARDVVVTPEVLMRRRIRYGSTMTQTPGMRHFKGLRSAMRYLPMLAARLPRQPRRTRRAWNHQLHCLSVRAIRLGRRCGKPCGRGLLLDALKHAGTPRQLVRIAWAMVRHDR